MVALVTGGGRGIGQGIALHLAKDGWSVAVAARSAGQLAETVKQAEGAMVAVPADVADPVSVRAMVRRVEQRLGPVDLLVNNAGAGGPMGPVWTSEPDQWWRCLEVNLRGPFLCTREILPGMIARQGGRIVNVVSGAGGRAIPDMSAYVVSKTALIRFSEQVALEAGPHGVRVFSIRPGVVRTAMFEEARPHIPLLQQQLDQGLEVTPEVVGRLVAFLASGRADALSGRLFSVYDKPDEIIARAQAVIRDELYVLRMRER